MMLALVLALLVSLASSLPVLASETVVDTGYATAEVPVIGTIEPLIISVTHPLNVSWQINPNNLDPFVIPTLQVTNNTKVAVTVAVTGLSKNALGSTLPFTDVQPTKYANWSELTLSQSKADFALGIKVRATGSAWNAGVSTATRWAADSGTAVFGSLDQNAVGLFEFDARHGLAFDQVYTAQHDVVFLFTLV